MNCGLDAKKFGFFAFETELNHEFWDVQQRLSGVKHVLDITLSRTAGLPLEMDLLWNLSTQ